MIRLGGWGGGGGGGGLGGGGGGVGGRGMGRSGWFHHADMVKCCVCRTLQVQNYTSIKLASSVHVAEREVEFCLDQ